ncbi:hypothetical protein EYC80_000543 [Monilinia laxa]|uniref:Uncharacterized protein n=1 Tax=Monilinia laxa TaxID=61186 RepID=A0A5N6KAY7_MONLA|nr:hypothetical protein EYC80_000543 [Monilinia laxa]
MILPSTLPSPSTIFFAKLSPPANDPSSTRPHAFSHGPLTHPKYQPMLSKSSFNPQGSKLKPVIKIQKITPNSKPQNEENIDTRSQKVKNPYPYSNPQKKKEPP